MLERIIYVYQNTGRTNFVTERLLGKSNLVSLNNVSKESTADKYLQDRLTSYSIHYTLRQREHPTLWPDDASPHRVGKSMPVLNQKGFLDFLSLTILADPAQEWANLSRCLRKYKLHKYSTWGNLPRETFPASPDPGTLRKLEDARLREDRELQREVDRMQQVADISRRGNQIAADAISSSTRYEYAYRY